MIYHGVLAASTTSTFVILPREIGITTDDNLTIVNQSTNKTLVTLFISAVYDSNNILTISFSLFGNTLDEGNFYTIDIKNVTTDAVLWRGVMFVSSQDKEDYTINKDEFKEKTSTNEYIILE